MFAIESSGVTPGEEVLGNDRPFELALALTNRAERLVPRTLQKEMHYQIVDRVLLRRGRQPEGSRFEARMWLGPFKVISVEHHVMCWKTLQKGILESLCTPGIYVDTKRGTSNISMAERIDRMVFYSRMKNRLKSKRVLV